MLGIGRGEAGGLGHRSPPAGSRGRAPVGDLEALSFSVYPGPKIPCFVTQNVLYEFVSE